MNSPRARHVPLGQRLEAAERIRAGTWSTGEAAHALGVAAQDVERWVASGERPVNVADILASPQERRLTRRAEHLVDLIAAADELIRRLNDRLAAECNKFGRFVQQGSRS
ncbi:MAG TPA: hypothetical protein VFE23_10215 [Usitatibacter sp.]|nr:hypothetical protein [Usitatibacter sp.]